VVGAPRQQAHKGADRILHHNLKRYRCGIVRGQRRQLAAHEVGEQLLDLLAHHSAALLADHRAIDRPVAARMLKHRQAEAHPQLT